MVGVSEPQSAGEGGQEHGEEMDGTVEEEEEGVEDEGESGSEESDGDKLEEEVCVRACLCVRVHLCAAHVQCSTCFPPVDCHLHTLLALLSLRGMPVV